VFPVALVRDFGWGRSVVAGAFSLFTLVHDLASFPIGWRSDRFGPRRLPRPSALDALRHTRVESPGTERTSSTSEGGP
jgi:hypothetical protein